MELDQTVGAGGRVGCPPPPSSSGSLNPFPAVKMSLNNSVLIEYSQALGACLSLGGGCHIHATQDFSNWWYVLCDAMMPSIACRANSHTEKIISVWVSLNRLDDEETIRTLCQLCNLQDPILY